MEMTARTHQQLDGVAAMLDQLIDATIDLLTYHMATPADLVLSLSREQGLRELQQLLHEELASSQPGEDTAWRLAGAILATVIADVLELSSSI
jgi:hypothetical protein